MRFMSVFISFMLNVYCFLGREIPFYVRQIEFYVRQLQEAVRQLFEFVNSKFAKLFAKWPSPVFFKNATHKILNLKIQRCCQQSVDNKHNLLSISANYFRYFLFFLFWIILHGKLNRLMCYIMDHILSDSDGPKQILLNHRWNHYGCNKSSEIETWTILLKIMFVVLITFSQPLGLFKTYRILWLIFI